MKIKTRVPLVAVAASLMAVVPMAAPAQAACDGKFYEQCQEVMIELQNFMCYTFGKCL
ncbi:MAG TPA: hypothetical protein VG318_11170 [Actinomycetota bacterium]|nr:hypothetical protein [Actinomycetota bacterium]